MLMLSIGHDSTSERSLRHCLVLSRVIKWGLPSSTARPHQPELSKLKEFTILPSSRALSFSRCLLLLRTTSRSLKSMDSGKRKRGTAWSLLSIQSWASWRAGKESNDVCQSRILTLTWNMGSFTLLHHLRSIQQPRQATF